jgi:hypothetical protein
VRFWTTLAVAGLGACTVDDRFENVATPQRPTVSDDTSTTVADTLELEAGLSGAADGFGTPATLKYGVDGRTELFLGFEPWVVVDQPGSDGRGFGDLVPGIRRRVVDQDGSRPSAAYEVAAKIPTANEDVGSGEIDLFASGIVSWDDPAWSATGYYRLGLLGEADGTDLQHVFAAAGGRPLVDRVSGFGELALLWTPAQDDEELMLTTGLSYRLHPGMVFDVGVAFGLSADAPDTTLLVGTTINFGRQPWRLRP